MTTIRQELVAKKVLESNGEKPISQAMLESGYPETTAKNPQQLTRSKGWKELMDEHFSDEKLSRIHDEGLEATRASNAAILVQKDGTMIKAEEQGLIEVPDYAVRHKYLETAYKLKGKYPAEKIQLSTSADEMTDEEIEDEIKRLEEKIKKI